MSEIFDACLRARLVAERQTRARIGRMLEVERDYEIFDACLRARIGRMLEVERDFEIFDACLWARIGRMLEVERDFEIFDACLRARLVAERQTRARIGRMLASTS